MIGPHDYAERRRCILSVVQKTIESAAALLLKEAKAEHRRAMKASASRRRREKIAAEKGLPEPRNNYVAPNEELRRERKKQLRRQYRKDAAAISERASFVPRVKCDSHVGAWRAHMRLQRGLIVRGMHNSHVALFKRLYNARVKAAVKYATRGEDERARRRDRTARLPDRYIASHSLGLPLEQCPPELIKAKRTHLQLVRTLKEKKEKMK